MHNLVYSSRLAEQNALEQLCFQWQFQYLERGLILQDLRCADGLKEVHHAGAGIAHNRHHTQLQQLAQLHDRLPNRRVGSIQDQAVAWLQGLRATR